MDLYWLMRTRLNELTAFFRQTDVNQLVILAKAKEDDSQRVVAYVISTVV